MHMSIQGIGYYLSLYKCLYDNRLYNIFVYIAMYGNNAIVPELAYGGRRSQGLFSAFMITQLYQG